MICRLLPDIEREINGARRKAFRALWQSLPLEAKQQMLATMPLRQWINMHGVGFSDGVNWQADGVSASEVNFGLG